MGLPRPTEGRVSDPNQMVPTVWNARLRATQPVMAFYTGMPGDAKCIFSASATEMDDRSLEHVLPLRRAEVWSGEKVRTEAALLRGSHPEEARGVVRPERWEDLWEYFDAHDLYFRGSWNLWLVVEQLCAENEERAMDDYDPAMVAEIEDWAWKWLTWERNRHKLARWDPSTDILSVFNKGDRDDVGTTEPVVLDIVRRELKYWHGHYGWGPEGSAARQHRASGNHTKTEKLPVSKTYESHGINNTPSALVPSAPRSSSALESHTQVSPAEAGFLNPRAGPLRVPRDGSQPTGYKEKPPGPILSRYGFVPLKFDARQNTNNPSRAGSSSHSKKTRKQKDAVCRNGDGKTNVFCPCQFCQFQSHCIYVGIRDRDIGQLTAVEFRFLAEYFDRWGQIEGFFAKSHNSLLIQYASENSVEDAIKWANSQPLPPITQSLLYVAAAILPKYYIPIPMVDWNPGRLPHARPPRPPPHIEPSGSNYPKNPGPAYLYPPPLRDIPGVGVVMGPARAPHPGGDHIANNMSRTAQLRQVLFEGPNVATGFGNGSGNLMGNVPSQLPVPGVFHPSAMPMPMPFNTTTQMGPQHQHQGRLGSSQLMPGPEFQFPNNQGFPAGPPAGPSSGYPPAYQNPASVYQGPTQPDFFSPPKPQPQDWDVAGQFYPPAMPYAPMGLPQPAYPPAAPMEASMTGYLSDQTSNQQQTGHYGHMDPATQSFSAYATTNMPAVPQDVSTSDYVFDHVAQFEPEPATIYNAATNEYDQLDQPMGLSDDFESYDGTASIDRIIDYDNTGTVIRHKSKAQYRLPSEWRAPSQPTAPASGNAGLPACPLVLPPELTGPSSARLFSTASGVSSAGNKRKKWNKAIKNRKKTSHLRDSSVEAVDTSATHAAQVDTHGSSQAGAQTNVGVTSHKKSPKKDNGKGVATDFDFDDYNVPAEPIQPLRLADWPRDPVSASTSSVLGGEDDYEFEMPPESRFRANAGCSLVVGRNRKKKAHVNTIFFAPLPEDDDVVPVVGAESVGGSEGKATVPVEAVPSMIDVAPSTVEAPVSVHDTSPPSSIVKQGNEVEGVDTTDEATTETHDPVPGWPRGILPFPEGPSRFFSLRNFTFIPVENHLRVLEARPGRPVVSHTLRTSEHSIISEYSSCHSDIFYTPPEVPTSPVTPHVNRVPSINVIEATPVLSSATTAAEEK